MSNFNFEKHREHKKSYKTIFRFVIYSIVIIVLLYLILSRANVTESIPVREIESIEGIEIELD